MANKKNKVKDVKVEGLDELVNEGKNIDIVKVEEIIANNSEEPSKEEETEVADTETAVEKEAEISEPTGEEKNDTVEEDYEAIDDVISECTGEIDSEVKEEKKPTEEKEPWYVSRARRITDYYNW